jgi:hypothetical protein
MQNMNTTIIASLATAVCATLALAADGDQSSKQLQVFPKNFARQHLGANLFVFNPGNQTFVPTQAAAAWLDDDISTGWPVTAGKQSYMIALPEPEMISNFSVSSRPAAGTVSIFAGDEPAAPGAKSWTPLAQDIPFDSINEKKLAKPFSRFAKYVLIQTDIADPGPLFSVYSLRKRETAIDARAIFGQFVNNKTAFNLNGLYAQGRVSSANSPEGFLPWQRGIDDNPESGITINASTSESGAVIAYGGTQSVSRVAVLADGAPKGKLPRRAGCQSRHPLDAGKRHRHADHPRNQHLRRTVPQRFGSRPAPRNRGRLQRRQRQRQRCKGHRRRPN